MPTPITTPERLLSTNSPAPEVLPFSPDTGAEAFPPEASLAPLGAVAVSEAAISTSTSERSRPMQRFFRSKLGRLAMSGLTALGLAGGAVALEASPAYAANPVYTAVNPDKDGTKSIYDRNSPRWADTNRKAPDFSYYGDRLELICGTNGEAIGPYNNKRWHYAKNLSRPEAGVTWIPDRYVNTPNKANQPTPGEKECGTTAPIPEAPKAKGCYFNLKAPSKNLTFSYGGGHRYLGNAHKAAENWTNAGAGISIKSGNSGTYIKYKDVDVSRPTVIEGKEMDAGTAAVTVIPENREWMGPYKEVPTNPKIPRSITILVNRHVMDKLNDFQRTYVFTHEAGHALGLGHLELCGYSDTSIMEEGDPNTLKRSFNTPTAFDKAQLRQLYGA